MPMRVPSETPRLLQEWRASQTPFMSQERAAKKLGVKPRNYARWERGEHLPHFTTIEKIAGKMDLEAEDFYPEMEETSAQTRQRIVDIEQMVREIHTALMQTLTPAQKKALGPLPGDATEVGTRRRSKRNGASGGRAQALG